MKSDAKRRTILSLLKLACKLNNFSLSSPSVQDLFPISEACRKHSSLRWSSWRSLRTQLYRNHSNLVKQDQVPACAFSWTNKTRSSILPWKNLTVQVPLIISASVTSKLNSLPQPLSMMRWSKNDEKSWKNIRPRKKRLSKKKLSVTSSKTGFNSVLSAVLLWFQTQNLLFKCAKSRWIERGKSWERCRKPTTKSRLRLSSMLRTDLFWLNKYRRHSSTIWTRSKSCRGTFQFWERLEWILTSI